MADVRMPPTHTDEGVRAAVQLRRDHPGVGVLVLSQYVEEQYATELLAGSSRGVGYLLKDRVAEVREFVDAVVRVAEGGTALDPEVVAQLLGRSRKQDVLAGLTPREREVLGLMAEGRTNSAVAKQLVVSDGAVEKHVSNIFLKLGLAPSEGDHRRVLAVLTYLTPDAGPASCNRTSRRIGRSGPSVHTSEARLCDASHRAGFPCRTYRGRRPLPTYDDR